MEAKNERGIRLRGGVDVFEEEEMDKQDKNL